jgi:hypothetical protein
MAATLLRRGLREPGLRNADAPVIPIYLRLSGCASPHRAAQNRSAEDQCADKEPRNEVPAARKLALSCLPNRTHVSVRVLHIFLIFCSRFISASLLPWRISDDASSFRAKADNPFWSNHVAAWYRSALDAEHYCRKHDLSTASLLRWAHHLVSAENLRKRTEDLQKLRRKKPERPPKNAQPNRPKRPRRNRYSIRTESGPIALRAFWSMHVEAMNWSGKGRAEYAAVLGLSPHTLRIWRDRPEQSGDEMDWRSLLHPSARAQLSSAANCARRKCRLTPGAADGRSNRRRFSDE